MIDYVELEDIYNTYINKCIEIENPELFGDGWVFGRTVISNMLSCLLVLCQSAIIYVRPR